MTLPTIFATLPAGNVPASDLDENFSVLEQGIVQPVASTGSVNSYVLAPLDPWVTGYSQYKGNGLNVIFPSNNTGATSVNVSGLGAIPVVKNVGGVATALGASDIVTGIPYYLICDGSQFWIIGLAGSATSAVRAYNNLKLINNVSTPNTNVDISATALMLTDATGSPFRVANVAVTINCTTVGVNGLDTGTLTNTTWYYMYIISNGSVTAGLASLSATTPTLPTGYTFFMRVGAFITDGTAAFKRILQFNNRAQYVVTTGSNTAAMPIMDSGTKGSVSTPTYVSVAVGNFVPATASVLLGDLGVLAAGNNAIAAPNSSYGVQGSTTNPPAVAMNTPSANGITNAQFEFNLESTNIFWASSNGILNARGWVDNL